MNTSIVKNEKGTYNGVALDENDEVIASIVSAPSEEKAQELLEKIVKQCKAIGDLPIEESPESKKLRELDLLSSAGAIKIEDEDGDEA